MIQSESYASMPQSHGIQHKAFASSIRRYFYRFASFTDVIRLNHLYLLHCAPCAGFGAEDHHAFPR